LAFILNKKIIKISF